MFVVCYCLLIVVWSSSVAVGRGPLLCVVCCLLVFVALVPVCCCVLLLFVVRCSSWFVGRGLVVCNVLFVVVCCSLVVVCCL